MTDISEVDIELIADGLEFPEGPVVMPDGSIVVCEIKGQRLTRIAPVAGGGWGPKELAATVPGGPNGAALGPDGAIYVCNNGGSLEWHNRGGLTVPGNLASTYSGGRIERVDLATGAVTVLYRESSGNPLKGPNDLVMDGHGGFWFTDHGTRTDFTADRTAIHYARVDGSSCIEAIRPVDGPNGIGLSPAGDRIHWAETHTGRVFSRPLTSPGVVGAPGPLNGIQVGLGGMQFLDSLAMEANGNVAVATIVNGGITVVGFDGKAEHVRLAEPYKDPITTNIAFGGDDMRTAYITLSGTGRLVAVRWPRPGLKLAY